MRRVADENGGGEGGAAVPVHVDLPTIDRLVDQALTLAGHKEVSLYYLHLVDRYCIMVKLTPTMSCLLPLTMPVTRLPERWIVWTVSVL